MIAGTLCSDAGSIRHPGEKPTPIFVPFEDFLRETCFGGV